MKKHDLKANVLRMSIMREERLQQQIARDEELRRTNPAGSRSREAARNAVNRDFERTNQRLRALGLEPVGPEGSLGRRRQELQRLKKRNAAAVAALKAERRTDDR
jgi:hypothetical protein